MRKPMHRGTKRPGKAGGRWAAAVTGVCVLLTASILWTLNTWTALTMDQLIYHLQANMQGVNPDLVVRYMLLALLPAALVCAVLALLYRQASAHGRGRAMLHREMLAALTALALTAAHAWSELEVSRFIRYRGVDTGFIQANYVDPEDVHLEFPQKKRNLIHIFLESMETTYADGESGGALPVNLIPNLTRIAQENEDFSGSGDALNGAHVMPYTSWTVAAMFAQTAGLPLKILVEDNSMGEQAHFFPGVVALGDILREQGYTQTLLIGSDAAFAGRDLYFTEHGSFELADLNDAREKGLVPQDYYVWWGYEDEKLFAFAREKLLELAQTGEPFNLTMLTTDTHFYGGYTCGQCPTTHGDSYSNAISCSDAQAAALIDWIQQQDFYENTTIVVTGDHLTMDERFTTEVYDAGDYARRTYTAYIHAAAQPTDAQKERRYTTMDLFPTTLAALGVHIEGDRLGLGTNLFSGMQTLIEQYGEKRVEAGLYERSRFMEALSGVELTYKRR